MDIIDSPGKFEGEPTFVPHFWGLALEGGADEDDGHDFVFYLTPEDHVNYPDLGDAEVLALFEDDNGFVYSDLFSKEKWDHMRYRYLRYR